MQLGSAARQHVNQRPQCTGDQHQGCGQRGIYRANEQDRADHGDTGRQHVPGAGVFHRERGLSGGGDPAGQRAGQTLGKPALRMAAQMRKQVLPDIAGDRDESPCRGPSADAPQQIVGGDKTAQEQEGGPDGWMCLRAGGDAIDQMLQAILRGDAADHGPDDGAEDKGMSPGWRAT